jgi:hypothetical protein
MSRINQTLKNMIDELDLDRRANDLVVQAESLLKRATDYTREHRDDVERALDRITTQIDERTEGRYAEQIGKVRGQLELGLSKLTEPRRDDSA